MTDDNDIKRISDKVGVIAIDATEYPQEQHVTTIDIQYLKTALEILENLGWDKIDVNAVPPKDEDSADHPLLVFRTPTDPFFAGENAGISIAPLTEQGRERDE